MAPNQVLEKEKAYDRGARRREKSRDAARCRRQQESDTFNEICKAIPVPAKQLAQMDRSTVMRLLISFMKLRNIANSIEIPDDGIKQEVSIDMPGDEDYVNALNGFLIVLSHDCDILFASTNVKQYIGITSLDLIGQNLFGYTHEGDHSEITNCLKATSEERKAQSFFMRMKSTLTASGKNVNLKSATYKVLKCEGVVHQFSEPTKTYMIAYCEPIPHPANIEMVLDCSTFLSQHSLDMKFTFCDTERVASLLGYNDDEMIGKSFYNFCHAEDIKALDDAMKKLFRLGQVTTNQYRMLAKCGGYVRVISEATIINNPRNQQPSYVVCVHYVISDIIDRNCILSLPQLEFSESSANVIMKQELQEIHDEELGPLDCTEALFCDSTNSIFCDDLLMDGTDGSFSGDATSKVFIPCTESMETLANNAPSIGDEAGYGQISFEGMFGIDDLRNNAPSIGDPLMSDPVLSPAQQGTSDLFPEVKLTGKFPRDNYNGQRYTGPATVSESKVKIRDWRGSCTPSPYALSPSASPPMPISTQTQQRRFPTGDFQVVTIPKSQYKRHTQPEISLTKETSYKVDPPDPPIKRQKFSTPHDQTALNTAWKRPYNGYQVPPGNTALLIQDDYKRNNAATLSSLLLQPGSKCDNLDFAMDSGEPSGDRDRSWPLARGSSLLPVISLHDCEVNAPVAGSASTLDWVTLCSALGTVA